MQPSFMNNYSFDFLSFVLRNDRISLSLLALYLVALLEEGSKFNTIMKKTITLQRNEIKRDIVACTKECFLWMMTIEPSSSPWCIH